ncbi:hypothetical protein ACHAXA_000182 [Cyclostephanos tholiformis]|uniref:Trs120/TRAPPC9 N-terminal domain-containing protein n=1 Tax=Cyclostephanos tholiformis TaxID=382380 RepID=A0ABD3R374_9STRA
MTATTTTRSQLPGRPSFRDSAMHAVAIVPLTVARDVGVDGGVAAAGEYGVGQPPPPPPPTTTTTHSERSFCLLISSLREFANLGRMSHQRGGWVGDEGEVGVLGGACAPITLILPHSQLTRPGDWRYDATPLRGHDWQSGCQRMRMLTVGRRSVGWRAIACATLDRLPALSPLQSSRNDGRRPAPSSPTSDPWMDLEPHRSTSAVIGVLNMRDCRDTRDLWRAEENLIQWARLYAIKRERENVALGAGDDHRIHAPILRLFVFDSFDESVQRRVDLGRTRFRSNQLVAFPPLDMGVRSGGANSQMMVLHWNVVVNDLAVALFRNVERKIRENDVLARGGVGVIGMTRQQVGGFGSGGSKSAPGADTEAVITSPSAPGNGNINVDASSSSSQSTAMTNTTAASTNMSTASTASVPVGVGGLLKNAKNAFDGWRPASSVGSTGGGPPETSVAMADHRRVQSVGGVGGGGISVGGATNRLVTPLDLDADDADVLASVTPRDVEALRRRDAGRREKRSADLSLLAGSPIDAYERYTRAAELTRHSHDPLWYASALEGCACAFVAMAEVGGHGVDEYMENNFQLPDVIMALAIAQGVASGADLGDVKGKTMTVDRTKTTLPQAVTALVEEALSVLCRHETLAPLHAGLLMKLAEYVKEDEEGHLRCRWGEGEYCYGGDVNSMAPRWDRTSVSKLDLRGTEVARFRCLGGVGLGCGGAGGGVLETRWGDSNSFSTPSRLRFPRKAAFFTLVAAEAMMRCQSDDAAEYASSLYLAASHLYSRQGNVFEHGDDCATRYGWATLRAAALQGMSSQTVEKDVAEAATELLVALLNEVSANQTPNMHVNDGALLPNYNDPAEYDRQQLFPDDSLHGTKGNQSDGKAKQVSRPLASMAKTPFFAQAPPSALSLSQSKWLEDDPVPHVQLPFVITPSATTETADFIDRASALSSIVASMSCVAAKIDFERCAKMQQICLANIKELRKQMGASSAQDVGSVTVNDSPLPSPLVVTSAKIVKEGSHLVLERTKALGYSAKFATLSMSTFFNPYAKKKQAEQDKNKIMTTLIAEGEERNIMVEFLNRLAVPLEVPSCRLEFEGKGADRIEAPPLSFTVPAKTSSFAVHFPFIVTVSKVEHDGINSSDLEAEEAEIIPDPDMFDVVGLRVTCLNRTFSIRFSKSEESVVKNTETCNENFQLPPPASVYQRSKHTQPKKDEQQLVVRLESVPAQPNLLISFAASQSPIEEDTSVPVHLSDGEIFTIPPFRLENDFGRSGMGEIERLQVLAVGLPGIPDETLFDTDALAAALEEEEDVLTETDSEAEEEDFEEMMECDGLPPLKMKVIAEGLNLRSINDKSKNKGEGSIVKFQMAATHDMGDQLSNGGNVRIRFRYRGPSPNPATEIWRKREVSLRIIRVKGPRISSLTFRSDLSWGSSYTELCNSLVKQRRSPDAASKRDSNNSRYQASNRSRSPTNSLPDEIFSVDSGDVVEHTLLNRVGMDQGVHISSDEVVLLMAVANETSSTIILSNRKGLVGGFEGSPMPTVRISSGVSVKIPVVIPRIDRLDENGNVTDLAAELVSRTALHWESEAVEGADGTEKIKRTGRVRIPSRCLREIIDEHKSFASRICTPPVSLSVSVGGEPKLSEISLPLGSAVQVDAIVTVQVFACPSSHPSFDLFLVSVDDHFTDWVPADIVSKCRMTLEFCCAEKQPGNSSSAVVGRVPYMWCGQLRRIIDLSNDEDDKTHVARIAFFQCGVFVVSVCAKISSRDAPSGIEESWWAPHAKLVRIEA